ncbi:Dfp1/Him1, central region-domain-containing protein [Aspergillus coremiiformis]|uniref:Dfp1/Him1, central region-domain-containing protein n=1 Tax=Aspergillus coremiiformis TaxID=138285 RepID=A0A5N6ZG08_9EURO|nr:Dfp1/Him1, central region-domain-containing protein [Aspergillus coremiiformis]
MSTRRPLANVPNATNSPHRAGLVPAKRPRTTNAQVDIPYGQPPPKKQVLDGGEGGTRSPTQTRPSAFQNPDSRLFARRANNTQPSAFERKLVAVRDKERQTQIKGTRHEKPSAEAIDSIRQWQKHYRKAFPQFVFYFDSIPEDLHSKCSRQVLALGAREEKFFSRLVTHVVTSRPIPLETDVTSPADVNAEPVDQAAADGTLQTVNPSLLDARREQSNRDVLHRARQMGMKIWAIEKLQRMITTINDGDIGGHGGHSTRNNHAGVGHSKGKGETDLSQVLQNELNGSSDRNPQSVLKDLVMFKGTFIYIHDMDEKTRPVMVREYPKVAKRQDGIWPQFRSAALGKCPFIDEPPTKKDLRRQRALQQENNKQVAPKITPTQETHALGTIAPEYALEKVADRTPKQENCPQDIHEEAVPHPKQLELQEMQPTRPISPRKSSESFVPPQINCGGRFYTGGREPAASGVQPSNITSAIRSQMVSSTAAGPGAKAGVSKEVHELKRKVLEKSNGGLSAGIGPSLYRTTDASAAFKMTKAQGNRQSKLEPPEKLGNAIEEETTQSESNDARKRRNSIRQGICQKKKERRRDPKPGYCENCRDKFDDFNEHIMTRKHRRFAANGANWAELDALLLQLQRPLKDKYAQHT